MVDALILLKGGTTMEKKRLRNAILASFTVAWVIIGMLPLEANAAIPPQINYQGYLTNASGVPVNGTVSMVFRIYNDDSGGTELWNETHNVTVSQGVYNVVLGASSLLPNPIALPFDQQYYLAVKVGTDPEMTPRIPLTSVGYAFRAQTVESVGSHSHSGADIVSGTVSEPRIDSAIARTSALNAHTSNVSNPHSTTAAQVGAAPAAHAHSGSDITTGVVAEARIDPLIARDSEVSAAIASHNHDDKYYNKAYVNALEARIAALEAKLAGLTRSGNDFVITNGNLYIQSGSGTTNGAVNGKGNLIIGYNELRGSSDVRTGSHNLIVGSAHNYSSYGGMVVGNWNTISGAYASVSAGTNNIASGMFSSVSGGEMNTASNGGSSVTGGDHNTASGAYSSVSGGSFSAASGRGASISGGDSNIASGSGASVSGGLSNTASGNLSSVRGGTSNTAIGYASSVSGGDYNTASGRASKVSGGRYNTASGDYSSVAGGGYDFATGGNQAFGHYSSILGGLANKAGDPALVDHNIGQYSAVSGGSNNTASGPYSSVSGGEQNTASGYYSSVSGGDLNTANGASSSIGAGVNNTANGFYSSVTGGARNTASGDWSLVSGGESNTAEGRYSSVTGGYACGAHGDDTSVSGGFDNHAYGGYSSISGGSSNSTADTANAGSISGGYSRSVTGWADWRAGGYSQDQ
jgi:hypothetical protein